VNKAISLFAIRNTKAFPFSFMFTLSLASLVGLARQSRSWLSMNSV